MQTRRHVLGVGGLLLTDIAFRAALAEPGVVGIRMRGDEEGAQVGFDPVGLLLRPGQTVRWRCEANYHTTTAYHLDNARHSLRIPREARPWASEVLMPGETFEVTLTAEGVYDYFCVPHERAGMVGRLIVGQPGGPGSLPFDWFKGSVEGGDWLEVPAAARATFAPVAEIMARQAIPGRAV